MRQGLTAACLAVAGLVALPGLAAADYLIRLTTGGAISTPSYREEDGQILVEKYGGALAIPRRAVISIEVAPPSEPAYTFRIAAPGPPGAVPAPSAHPLDRRRAEGLLGTLPEELRAMEPQQQAAYLRELEWLLSDVRFADDLSPGERRSYQDRIFRQQALVESLARLQAAAPPPPPPPVAQPPPPPPPVVYTGGVGFPFRVFHGPFLVRHPFGQTVVITPTTPQSPIGGVVSPNTGVLSSPLSPPRTIVVPVTPFVAVVPVVPLVPVAPPGFNLSIHIKR